MSKVESALQALSYNRPICFPARMENDPDDDATGYWLFTLLVGGAFVVAAWKALAALH